MGKIIKQNSTIHQRKLYMKTKILEEKTTCKDFLQVQNEILEREK